MGSKFSPVVKEKRYFAPNEPDSQGGGPAEDQSFRSKHKVPEDIVPESDSSRRFPGGREGEKLSERMAKAVIRYKQLRPVVKTTVTSLNAGGRRFESCHG